MILYEYIPKRKKSKPTAAKRLLQKSWTELLEKYNVKQNSKRNLRPSSIEHILPIRDHILPIREVGGRVRSLGDGIGTATKKATNVYTGTAMIGIATMHKSNSVPVFSVQEAMDISKMRRG